ncbi:MAG: hypothetical protein WA647_18505 [Candidatus Acidiferrum sp.]
MAILGGGNSQNLNQEPDTSPTFWQATGQVQFFGAWDSGTTYGVGALVDFGGVIYISIQASNLNNEPDVSPLWWTATGNESFAGAWSSATAYTTGQTVTDSGSLYIALQNSTNQDPTSTTGYWQLITGSTIFYGNWSNTQAYPVGAQVFYNGALWLATAANTNQTPAPGSSYWENVGTSAILLAAWSSSVAYTVGMEVTFGGFVFQSIQAGTNQTPPTPPATSAYWTNMGPASIDPSTAYILMKGSVPGTLNNGFAYTSTTSGATIAWNSQAIYRADGSITNIANGSQAVTGLASGTTYYAFPYWNEAAAALDFVSDSSLTIPNITGVSFGGTQEITTTSQVALPTPNFSIAGWIKTAAGYTGGLGGIICNATNQTGTISSANTRLELGLDGSTSGLLVAAYTPQTGSSGLLTSTVKVNDGLWHFVVFSVTGSVSQSLYIDGVLNDTTSVTGNPSTTLCYYRLVKNTANTILTGLLSEVAVFSSALSAVQVGELYSAGSAVSQAAYEAVVTSLSPTYWWKLTDTSGSTAHDSADSNPGTYTNSPTLNQTSAVTGTIGSPSVLWPNRNILATQAQNLQGFVPLSDGGIAVATPATGSGGGGTSGSGNGGSGTGCYSGDTLVCTPDNEVPIASLKPGDIIISKTGPQRIREVLRHESETRKMIRMKQGLVTPNHAIFDKADWVPASEVFTNCPIIEFDGPVFNLLIDADDFESKSFFLANGHLSHNGKFI